ncbi:hypothetical protein BPO_1161 [Bergeyella porcorum]|uniref:Uncharacterized protein n=1 Tax=Bergeyella porcorum TaxID=1735111 RepID=A0AAU0F1Z6_9FLAO
MKCNFLNSKSWMIIHRKDSKKRNYDALLKNIEKLLENFNKDF